MKVGDLVRPRSPAVRPYKRRYGIVMELGSGHDGKQVRVAWDKALWYDKEGYSAEYPEELEVISENR